MKLPWHRKSSNKATTPARTRRVADYDFYKSIGPTGGRKRRIPVVEQKSEEGILTTFRRAQGVNLARDMVRNSPGIHGMLRSMRTNVIGADGKLRFYEASDWHRDAQNWFNRTWAQAADYIDGTSWREMEQLAVVALENEGDFVVVFDDGILSGGNGTGTVATWETDQVANIVETDFAPWATRGYTQENGVVRNESGRVCGVFVSKNRGPGPVPLSDALAFVYDTPEQFRAAPVKLVYRKFRLRQLRGVADSIPALQTAIDCHEILGYELQTAKAASSRYASVIDGPQSANGTMPTGYADIADPDAIADAAADTGATADPNAVDEDALIKAEAEARQAAGLEDYTGGNMDYFDNGTSVVFDPANRPNANLPAFLDYTGDLTGGTFGLNHSYSRMKAEGSYTAFRGDLALTWRTFEDLRQFLEDTFFDWVAVRAIRWAIGQGILPEGPAGWEEDIAWTYPPMIAVDEDKAVKAIEAKIKAGLSTYRQELGPAWREQLEEIAEERRIMHEMGLRHPQDETAAGVPVDPTEAADTVSTSEGTNE